MFHAKKNIQNFRYKFQDMYNNFNYRFHGK